MNRYYVELQTNNLRNLDTGSTHVLYIYAYSEEQVRDQLSECNIICVDLTD